MFHLVSFVTQNLASYLKRGKPLKGGSTKECLTEIEVKNYFAGRTETLIAYLVSGISSNGYQPARLR